MREDEVTLIAHPDIVLIFPLFRDIKTSYGGTATRSFYGGETRTVSEFSRHRSKEARPSLTRSLIDILTRSHANMLNMGCHSDVGFFSPSLNQVYNILGNLELEF